MNKEENIEKLEAKDDAVQKEEVKPTKKKKAVGFLTILAILFILGLIRIVTAVRNYTVDKPIIYLYPEEEIEISVTLGKKDNLTHTYPKYIEEWNVIAKPNGDLMDSKTGRSYYALYWEGVNQIKPNLEEGFVVKGEEIISFLEEKLEILGLNKKEANEFIIYWLPQLESNSYNFIRFQTIEEIDENMPLTIIPTPDTLIRIMMEFKALQTPIKVREQILETVVRKGYVAVEWGGTKIK